MGMRAMRCSVQLRTRPNATGTDESPNAEIECFMMPILHPGLKAARGFTGRACGNSPLCRVQSGVEGRPDSPHGVHSLCTPCHLAHASCNNSTKIVLNYSSCCGCTTSNRSPWVSPAALSGSRTDRSTRSFVCSRLMTNVTTVRSIFRSSSPPSRTVA